MANKKEVKVEDKNELLENDIKNKAYFPIIMMVIISILLCIIFVPKMILKIGSDSLEKKLSNDLVEMGSEFYKENYYPGLVSGRSKEEVSQILKNFESIGITIDLENLGRYNPQKNNERIKEFKNKKGEKCKRNTTRAVIYPKKPYGKNDYKVEADLDCGFTKKNKNKK